MRAFPLISSNTRWQLFVVSSINPQELTFWSKPTLALMTMSPAFARRWRSCLVVWLFDSDSTLTVDGCLVVWLSGLQTQQLRMQLLSQQQQTERAEEMLRLQKAIATDLAEEVRFRFTCFIFCTSLAQNGVRCCSCASPIPTQAMTLPASDANWR